MSAAAALAALLLGSTSVAEEPARPSAPVQRVERAPVVDGVLDEECWRAAPTIGPLRQMTPQIDAEPSEPTEVRIVHDGRALYFGIRCFDRDPGAIVATLRQRDADPDDRIEILIDTFHDRRNAYFFQIGAAGSLGDALTAGTHGSFVKAWDGIWDGAARVDDLGWTAEIEIPLATLAFDPAHDAWGFNINRCIKRREEFDRWSGFTRDSSFFRLATAGDLCGLSGLEQGLGLDVVPYFTVHANDERDGEATLLGRTGGDAFWRITPSLQAALTVNTDFAETEVDDRRVNLTRFPLFFPEKRDFFLQDATIFQFADLSSSLLLPFFSRRIGLDSAGNEVPIRWGAKLTGRQDDWSLGLLDVEIGSADGLGPQNLGVARIVRNLGQQSTIGLIGTAGDPAGASAATTYGADLNLSTSRFDGDQNLRSSLWVLRTENEGAPGGDLAFGATLAYPNDLWNWRLTAGEVQAGFDPKLGFVPRTGIRRYEAAGELRPRLEGALRRLEFQLEGSAVTDLDDRLETGVVEAQPLGVELDSGDEGRIEVRVTRDRLDEAFEIEDGVTIPPGEYDFVRARAELETSQKRALSATLAVEGGGFYDGRRFDVAPSLLWRPNALLNASLQYERQGVDLPGGAFTVHVGRARVDLSFSPRLQWSSFVQFDNESDSAGLNSRLRWIFGPGQELFLVYNTTVQRVGGALVAEEQAAAFKVAYTLRF